MADLKKDIHDLIGYGQKVNIVTGVDNEKKEVIEEFHFTPVSLKNLPELNDCLLAFFDATQKKAWNKDSLDQAANVIVLSLKRMHPDIEKDEVLEKFSLGGLAKAVKIAMDINNFLSEMGEISQGLNLTEKMQGKMGEFSQQKA